MQSFRVQQVAPIGDGVIVPIDMDTDRVGPAKSGSVYRIIVSTDRFVKFSATPTACLNDGTEGALLKAGVEYFLENTHQDSQKDARKFICFSVAIVVANDNVIELIKK